jgi:hypothetical protein
MTVEFISHPAFWIVLAAASELIALSPLKSKLASYSFCCKPCTPSSRESADQLWQAWLATSARIRHSRMVV